MAGGRTGLTKTAKALFRTDLRGVKNELAEIMEEAKSGNEMTREEAQMLTLRKQLCTEAERIIRAEAEGTRHGELIDQLQATQDVLKHKASGSTNFTPDQVQLPRRQGPGAPTQR